MQATSDVMLSAEIWVGDVKKKMRMEEKSREKSSMRKYRNATPRKSGRIVG